MLSHVLGVGCESGNVVSIFVGWIGYVYNGNGFSMCTRAHRNVFILNNHRTVKYVWDVYTGILIVYISILYTGGLNTNGRLKWRVCGV